MSKTGHSLIGLSLAAALYSTGTSLFVSVCAFLGANAPDYLEMSYWNDAKGRYSRLIPHRTLTHYVPLWVALTYFFSAGYAHLGIAIYPPLRMAALGYCYGVISHLVADMGTPTGLPFITPFGKRWATPFYKTGKSEWRLVVPVMLIAGGLAFNLHT